MNVSLSVQCLMSPKVPENEGMHRKKLFCFLIQQAHYISPKMLSSGSCSHAANQLWLQERLGLTAEPEKTKIYFQINK